MWLRKVADFHVISQNFKSPILFILSPKVKKAQKFKNSCPLVPFKKTKTNKQKNSDTFSTEKVKKKDFHSHKSLAIPTFCPAID